MIELVHVLIDAEPCPRGVRRGAASWYEGQAASGTGSSYIHFADFIYIQHSKTSEMFHTLKFMTKYLIDKNYLF